MIDDLHELDERLGEVEVEFLRYRILDVLSSWSVDDPLGCREWLGQDAEQILAMISDRGRATSATR